MQPIELILVSVAASVVGQLTLKSGMARLGPLALGQGSVAGLVWRIFSHPRIWLGLALFGVGTFFWLIALSRVQLAFAYPFLSLSYVLVVLASWALLHENLSGWRLIGIAAICFGVYYISVG
jgi:drug/metabolite transporter (DMT)-like permease